MITAMERLVAAARGEASDRIPIFCNLIDQGPKELGVTPREYFSSGELVAEGQLRLQRKYGYDNVWGLFYVGKEAELMGCRKIIFADDGPPNVGEMVVKTYDDISRLEVPGDPAGHPAFREPLKCLRLLREETGGRFPICVYLTASMTLPAILMGMDKWLELLLGGPTDVRDELLSKCSDFFRKEIAVYRAAGADILLYSNPFGSLDFVTPAIFRDLSLPWMERDLSAGGVEGVVYYCGGARMNPVIDQVHRRLGFPTYYLSPMDDIAQGKAIIGGRALCAGVINDIKLIDWPREEIRREVRRMIEAGMPGRRFLFGTLVMPLAIPEVNIRSMLEAACEYGRFADRT